MVLKYAPTTIELEQAVGGEGVELAFDTKTGAVEPDYIDIDVTASDESDETSDMIDGL